MRHRQLWTAIAAAVVVIGFTPALAHAENGAGEDAVVVEVGEVTIPPGGTNCEAAFVVKDYGGAPGTVGLISAGHCDTPGHALLSSNSDADFEVVTTGYTVMGTTGLPSGAELHSANFFRANSDNRSAWANPDRSNAVNPQTIGTASVGTQVCRFGGVSPTACGTVTSTNVAPRGVGFAPDTFGFLRLDFPCIGGDSGAAVLTADGTQAIGIISGRRLSDGACYVSQLSRVGPKVAGLALYQPPAPGQKFQLLFIYKGEWASLGVPATREKCQEVVSKRLADGKQDMRCMPV